MVKNKELRKEFFMEIKKSLPRFLSIFFIVALGTAFYAGIQATAPDMHYTGDAYFDERELMDLKTISTMGLTAEDVEALQALPEIELAEASYMTDVLTGEEGSQQALRFESLPEHLNLPKAEEGSLPTAVGECLIDYDYAVSMGYQVGDTIQVLEDVEDEEDQVLKTHTFTITGLGSSPLYIAFTRGNTTIGNGEVAGFVYVPAQTFDTDYYMQIYMKAVGAKETIAYQGEYEQIAAKAQEQVKAIESERCDARYAEIQGEAWEELADAKQEFEDGKKEANEELADAKQELADGRKELEEGKKDLEDAKQELADGKAELDAKKQELVDGKKQIEDGFSQIESAEATLAAEEKKFLAQKKKAQKEINKAEKELAAGKKELASNQKTFNTQKKQFDTQKTEYQTNLASYNQKKAEYDSGYAQFQTGKQQYEAAVQQLESAKAGYEQLKIAIDAGAAAEEQIEQAKTLEATIAQLEQTLPETKSQLDATEAALTEAVAGLTTWKTQLDAAAPQITQGEQQIKTAEAQLKAAQKELNAGEKELQKSKKQLADGEKEIADAKKELEEQKEKLISTQSELADGEAQIVEAEKELADGEQEIKDGESELAENEQKLIDGEEEYKEAESEAQKELADGEQEIADAEKEIAELDRPEWTVSDRDDLLEYTGYGENADRMRSIGEVFPVIFFLVAALISLTTMTRMVEEERTQIGTLKALGYGKVAIASKYVLYALLATLGGSIFGVVLGQKILPFVIIRAYGIMYQHMDALVIPLNLKYALIATGAAVFCTMIATVEACARELQAWPAILMRPPSPKQGKRVLLERIPFLWNHLGFTWKSTIRNLFRYKKRFFMTILGIGGCMGLLLVGFGLSDSIMDVGRIQYQELQLYDGMIMLDEDAGEKEEQELLEQLSEDTRIEAYTKIYMKNINLISEEAKRETYLMVMPEIDSADGFFDFRDRQTGERFALDDTGMLLSEKTAKILKVAEGDGLSVEGWKGEGELPIANICENYMSHYAYLTENLYEQIYGETPKYNCILYRVTDRDALIAQEAGESTMKYEAALSVSYTSNIEQQLNHMLESLDSVLIVLITAAGMLAFVVLYNLNNININERKRELATLKVLGFFDREVSAYVYRENILLTLLGSVFGIFLGILMHRFIIVTVEVDTCMFGRNINLPSFVLAVVLTFAFSAFVNFVMYYKLKKIDMVESLKSVE